VATKTLDYERPLGGHHVFFFPFRDHLVATKWFQPWTMKDHLVVLTLDPKGDYQKALGGFSIWGYQGPPNGLP
jgi:hypothetical protein